MARGGVYHAGVTLTKVRWKVGDKTSKKVLHVTLTRGFRGQENLWLLGHLHLQLNWKIISYSTASPTASAEVSSSGGRHHPER